MIDVPTNPRYSANDAVAETDHRCYICGKDVNPNTAAEVHVHDGGSKIVTEEEAAALDSRGDLGLQYIGRDCLKKHHEIRPYVRERGDAAKRSRSAPRKKPVAHAPKLPPAPVPYDGVDLVPYIDLRKAGRVRLILSDGGHIEIKAMEGDSIRGGMMSTEELCSMCGKPIGSDEDHVLVRSQPHTEPPTWAKAHRGCSALARAVEALRAAGLPAGETLADDAAHGPVLRPMILALALRQAASRREPLSPATWRAVLAVAEAALEASGPAADALVTKET